MSKPLLLLALAGCWVASVQAADSAFVTGQPSVFWHDGEWQTYANGTWVPYGKSMTPNSPNNRPAVIHVQGQPIGGMGQLNSIGQPPTGFGQPPTGFGQTPTGLGQTTIGMGQQPSGLGQTTIGVGQQPSGLGQTTIGIGQQPSGLGQPNNGLGRTTIGIGQPNSTRPPSSFNSHVRPSSRVGQSTVNNHRSNLGQGKSHASGSGEASHR